jgi:hypothetical protein
MAVMWIGTPGDILGEFYRYVDEDGTARYVDDISKIPVDRRPSVKAYEEKYDHLDAEEREKRIREDRSLQDAIEAAERKEREAAGEGRGAPAESSVLIAGNQVLVPALLGYKGREMDVTFLLDTGASVTTLHKSSIKPLGVFGGIPSRLQVVGGKTIPSKMVKFDFIQVGTLRIENIYASVLEHKGRSVQYAGLLGMNFLRYADYSIDFDRQVISWRPKRQ